MMGFMIVSEYNCKIQKNSTRCSCESRGNPQFQTLTLDFNLLLQKYFEFSFVKSEYPLQRSEIRYELHSDYFQ